MSAEGPLRCPCGGQFLEQAFEWDAPPPGETAYPIDRESYHRRFDRCGVCRHFVADHALDLRRLYEGGYVEATYGEGGLLAAFERIVALPPELSDNVQRVQRVLEFAAGRQVGSPPSALDVGSGLCVFLNALQAHGWSCTALDPDARAAEHARSVVGVTAVTGGFGEVHDLGRFDLVSFNKVLEHVEDPVGMLAEATANLTADGFVYVEVPDGEVAAEAGADREEFFIDHLHAFSPASLALAADRAGFRMMRLDRLHEPSTKYTLAAFLELQG